MDLRIVDYILLAGVLQGFVFNGFTLLRKTNTKTIIFLSMVVFFLSLNNLQAWLIDIGFSSGVFIIKQLLVPWYSLIAPMFFLFLIHYLKVENRYESILKFVVFVFLLQLVIRLSIILYTYFYGDTSETSLIESYTTLEEITNAIIAILFVAKSLQIVFLKTEFHDFIKTYDSMKWLKIFLILGIIVVVFWVFAIVVNLNVKTDWANNPLRISTSILLYWIGYQGVYKYDLLMERISIRETVRKNSVASQEPKTPNNKSEILNNKYASDFERIDSYILQHKLHLDPNFGLDFLSREIEMSVSHISKVINATHSSNFSDYINAYKVEQAKIMLSDRNYSNYTIVAIGLESGFNSKSAFYNAFKKFTGQTPTQYKTANS